MKQSQCAYKKNHMTFHARCSMIQCYGDVGQGTTTISKTTWYVSYHQLHAHQTN